MAGVFNRGFHPKVPPVTPHIYLQATLKLFLRLFVHTVAVSAWSRTTKLRSVLGGDEKGLRLRGSCGKYSSYSNF